MHNTSHRLKKIGNRSNVSMVLSTPEKLEKLCQMTNPFEKKKEPCTIKHSDPFVACVAGVEVPLSCGSSYIGQTGRCLNDRLREHSRNVGNYPDGSLSVHCHECGITNKKPCKPLFNMCRIVDKNKNQGVREIIEANCIRKAGAACVSAPSVFLYSKETKFLCMAT